MQCVWAWSTETAFGQINKLKFASLLHVWGKESCLWSAISIHIFRTHKINTCFLSHLICKRELTLKLSERIFHPHQLGFYSDAPPPKNTKQKASRAPSRDGQLHIYSQVKVGALTFTRAKLDVTLHSIQNINPRQDMAATSTLHCHSANKLQEEHKT